MSRRQTQQFDFAQASALESSLRNDVSYMNDALDRIKTTVETCREWWKGGSEQAFIDNFASTKKEIKQGLEKWLQEYAQLIKKVQAAKTEQENALKKALSR